MELIEKYDKINEQLDIFEYITPINESFYTNVNFDTLNDILIKFKQSDKNWQYLVCLYQQSSALFYRLLLKLIFFNIAYEESVDTYYIFYDELKQIEQMEVIEQLNNRFISLLNKIKSETSNINIKEYISNCLKIWNNYNKLNILNELKDYLYNTDNLIKVLKNKENDEKYTKNKKETEKLTEIKSLEGLEYFIDTYLQPSEKIKINSYHLYLDYEKWAKGNNVDSYKFDIILKQNFRFIEDNNYNLYFYLMINSDKNDAKIEEIKLNLFQNIPEINIVGLTKVKQEIIDEYKEKYKNSKFLEIIITLIKYNSNIFFRFILSLIYFEIKYIDKKYYYESEIKEVEDIVTIINEKINLIFQNIKNEDIATEFINNKISEYEKLNKANLVLKLKNYMKDSNI